MRKRGKMGERTTDSWLKKSEKWGSELSNKRAAKKVKTGQQLRRKVAAKKLNKEGSEGITKRTIKQQGGRRPNPTEKKRTNSQQDNQQKCGINL